MFGSLAKAVTAKLPDPGEYRDFNTSLDGSTTDPWMRYRDLADVTEWFKTFIVPRLPRMLLALSLGKPRPMATPELAVRSLSVAVEGDRIHLRLSAADAPCIREALQKPWRNVTLLGPTHTLTLGRGRARADRGGRHREPGNSPGPWQVHTKCPPRDARGPTARTGSSGRGSCRQLAIRHASDTRRGGLKTRYQPPAFDVTTTRGLCGFHSPLALWCGPRVRVATRRGRRANVPCLSGQL